MAERRKEIRLWAAGKYHRLGTAADWEEVAVAVDVFLDQSGYDLAWHLDPTTSVEQADHFYCELTTDDSPPQGR
jgi:hypothetical protein